MSSHSVTPSQSVSNVECSVMRGGAALGLESVEPLGVPESPFPYLHLIEAGGRGEVIAAYWKAYAAYAETVKTTCQLRVGALSEGSVSDSSGSSRGSRRRRTRRRRSADSSLASSPCRSDIDAILVNADEPGYCYLAMFREHHRVNVSVLLGEYPTFDKLLAHPRHWYVPFEQAVELRVSRTSPGMYHLGLKHGPTLPECVRVLLRDTKAKSPWTDPRIPMSDDLYGRVQLYDRLGGTVQPYRADLSYDKWLACVAGHEGDVFPSDKVALLSKAAGLRSPYEKVQGKMLEALGDSVLSTSVALRCVERELSAEEYQTARSEVTTNPSLSRIFAERVPVGFVGFPTGVSPGTGKSGAYMLEAIIGAVYQVYGQGAVDHACDVLGIFDLHRW